MRSAGILAFTFAVALARAGEIPIDISALANEPWTFVGPNNFIITNGSTFPTGNLNLGGIPFVIPSGPNNYWAGGATAGFGPGTVSLTIPVGVPGVTSVFTLLNTMWGQFGPNAYLFITFRGSNGAIATVPLVGNVNVRDYNNDGGDNQINATSTVLVWDNGIGQRLDRQEFIFPPALAGQTLTSVTITDTGNEVFSRAIFSGLTVSTCHSYVTASITVSSDPIVYHPGSMLYAQDVYLSNTGSTAVPGPLFLILEDIPKGVAIENQFLPTSCYAPVGSPSLLVIPKGSTLAPNTSVAVPLRFSDPSGTAIAYTPLTVIGIP